MTAEQAGVCEIRPMKNTDAPAAAALEQLCFSDPWGMDEFREIEESRLDRGIAAWADGRFMGYVILRMVAGEGEILRVAVEPSGRRQGIGRMLVAAAKSAAEQENGEKLFLEVRAGNQAAIRLYHSSGFSEYGTRKNYYRFPTEDAVLMEYSLA